MGFQSTKNAVFEGMLNFCQFFFSSFSSSYIWNIHLFFHFAVKMPKKRPEYRADRDHLDFLSSLKDHLPSIDDFEEKVKSQLSEHYDVCIRSVEDLEQVVSTLHASTPEREMKLLVRTKMVSVQDHLDSLNQPKMTSEEQLRALNKLP